MCGFFNNLWLYPIKLFISQCSGRLIMDCLSLRPEMGTSLCSLVECIISVGCFRLFSQAAERLAQHQADLEASDNKLIIVSGHFCLMFRTHFIDTFLYFLKYRKFVSSEYDQEYINPWGLLGMYSWYHLQLRMNKVMLQFFKWNATVLVTVPLCL